MTAVRCIILPSFPETGTSAEQALSPAAVLAASFTSSVFQSRTKQMVMEPQAQSGEAKKRMVQACGKQVAWLRSPHAQVVADAFLSHDRKLSLLLSTPNIARKPKPRDLTP